MTVSRVATGRNNCAPTSRYEIPLVKRENLKERLQSKTWEAATITHKADEGTG